MKLLISIFITAIIYIAYVPFTHGANLAMNICEYVAVDDKGRLRKLLKANRLKLRKVFKDTRCNNDNLLIFAAKEKADDIGQLLIKKLPKAVLEAELENLASISVKLAELAKVRLN